MGSISKYESRNAVNEVFCLNPNRESTIRLLFVISNINDLYFCPILPYLIVILLHLVSEDEIYIIISAILDNSELRKKYLIINQRFYEAFIEHLPDANPANLQFSSQHPSLYGYIFRSWLSTMLINSLKSNFFLRSTDAFFDAGIWLFPAFYVTYLNNYSSYFMQCNLGSDEEQNAIWISNHLKSIDEAELELMLIDSIHTSELNINEHAMVHTEMEEMQHRIDEGEDIMNICKYHLYYVIGSSKLLTADLCKQIMTYLPVRVQSQDPRLIYTSIINGYHMVHLLECAERHKPTLLLMQVEYSGQYIGLFREDRWSRRRDSHGQPDTILLTINFYRKHNKNITQIKKWIGRTSDQFVDGVEKPIQYVYVRSTEQYLMIGAGGRKGISFYTSEDYTKAYSQQSEVYENPALCDREFFSVSNVELFDFVSPGML